jgi:amino acid adenylation domain-containing protein
MGRAAGIPSGFLTQVAHQPDAPALVWHHETTTYAELNQLAAAARQRIEQLDLADDEPVAILAKKSPLAIALVLACLQSGRRFLLPSPTLAEATLNSVLERAGCRVLLSPDDELPISARPQAPRAPRAIQPTDVSFMLTTSGSTGLPKVVPLSHVAVERFTAWACGKFCIGPGRTVLNYAPLNFDLCLLDIWTTLRYGGKVVLVDSDHATNGAHLLDLIVRHRVNVVQSVPMFYRLLVDAVSDPKPALDRVEHVIFTGDAIPARTLVELPELFGRARLYNIYGCTETNDSFIHEVDAIDLLDAGAEPLPLGRPLPGVRTLIVEPNGNVLTGSGTGELYVSTPFQTEGYLDQTLNADKFVPHPLGQDQLPYLRTGDLVRRTSDGRIVLQGRNDFQVKVRGVAVNTAEIERVLLDHDQVAEAAVVALADPVAGRKLHAAVRRSGDGRLNSLVLRQHTAQRLVAAAIPSTIRIVDEPLPKTSTGKVDRKLVERSFAVANNQGE